MMALAFFLVTVAFAAGLLVNHLVALRDRVEISALELARQNERLSHMEQSLAIASDTERPVLEEDLVRLKKHLEASKLLFDKELRSYNSVSKALPGGFVSSIASLPATAKALA